MGIYVHLNTFAVAPYQQLPSLVGQNCPRGPTKLCVEAPPAQGHRAALGAGHEDLRAPHRGDRAQHRAGGGAQEPGAVLERGRDLRLLVGGPWVFLVGLVL